MCVAAAIIASSGKRKNYPLSLVPVNEIQSLCDSVTQLQSTVTVNEEEDVILQCNYTTTSNTLYLFWYRQYPNKSPDYILGHTAGKGAEFEEESFSRNVSQAERTVPLNVLQVRVTDSAGYYCTLSPTEAQISGSALKKLPCGVLWLSGYSTRLTSDRNLQNETLCNILYSTE
uniref:Ig-like domain-containing protein n=1 Tax=Callorhinchus milii TaxID=7868 RepID=A0A4W3J1L1_CALMI